jgi:hypothetical protein
MSARSLWSAVYSNVLPKRKSVVRAFLFSLVGLLPFLIIMLIKKPQFLVPFLLLLGYVGHLLGLTSDIMKQLRWMKRLSEQGPIFWAAARGKRALVRFSRWCYGDAMDVLPAGLSDLGQFRAGLHHAHVGVLCEICRIACMAQPALQPGAQPAMVLLVKMGKGLVGSHGGTGHEG